MLMNGTIIVYLSAWILFNFDPALNRIELSIRLPFCYFFVYMENKSKFK